MKIDFINDGNNVRYEFMNGNFTDLEKEVKMEQVHKGICKEILN